MTETELLKEAERIEKLLAEHSSRHDREASFSQEGWEALRHSPLNTALLKGTSWLTFGRILSTLCRGDASMGTVWLMHQGAAVCFLALRDEKQRAFFEGELRGLLVFLPDAPARSLA